MLTSSRVDGSLTQASIAPKASPLRGEESTRIRWTRTRADRAKDSRCRPVSVGSSSRAT